MRSQLEEEVEDWLCGAEKIEIAIAFGINYRPRSLKNKLESQENTEDSYLYCFKPIERFFILFVPDKSK
jgi:hypothetical protein